MKPAEIEISIDKALGWLQNGAQPTDTVRAILSYKGVLYKYHLLKGVQKGALTLEQAEAKFQVWQSEKEAKIQSKINETALGLKNAVKMKKEEESKVNEAKAAAVAKKLAKAQEKESKAAEAESHVAEPEAQVAEPEAQAAEPEAQAAEPATPAAEPEPQAAEPTETAAAEETPVEEPKQE
jgi:small subunit ribosomal protein S16